MLLNQSTFSMNWLMYLLLSVLAVISIAGLHGVDCECKRKYFGPIEQSNIACVCNSIYCDDFEFDWPKQDEILIVATDRMGKRLQKETIDLNSSNATIHASKFKTNNHDKTGHEDKYIVKLLTGERKQKILGFGGAFTDAATMHLAKMEPNLHQVVLDQYYGPRGLSYNMGRVTISGSDFSERAYSYDDLDDEDDEEDLKLAKFKLQMEDIKYKIPSILKAKSIVEQQQQTVDNSSKELLLFASSWSAPAWMKDNNNLVGGHLKGNSSGLYYDAFARYLIRFLDEYKKLGVEFWGMTSQNEPDSPTRVNNYTFNSLIFNKDQLNEFVRDNLGPTLAKHGYSKENNFNLIVFDDNLYSIEEFIAKTMALDKQTMDYVSGVGIHWYARHLVSYDIVNSIEQSIPASTFILSTEACHEHGPKPGDWSRGADYAYDIVQTLSRGTVGWVDWNLLVDMSGGPNWVKNFVDAPILYDQELNQFYKNPMYYILAHFTRFLERDAHIIKCEVSIVNSRTIIASDKVEILSANNKNKDNNSNKEQVVVLAAERPNKSHYSVIILNNHDSKKLITVQLDYDDDHIVLNNLIVEPHSVTTLGIPKA